jgi:hypothetical protein
VYTTAPFEQLFADERRCPRCTQLLFSDRRSGANRRRAQRRRPIEVLAASPAAALTNGAPTNGSSGNGAVLHDTPTASERANEVPVAAVVAAESERRTADRRQTRRRRDDLNPFQRQSEEAGWAG